MGILEFIIIAIVTISAIFIIIGIIRPGIVIWWNARRTRVNVLLIYGTIHFISLVAFFIYYSTKKDPFKAQQNEPIEPIENKTEINE